MIKYKKYICLPLFATFALFLSLSSCQTKKNKMYPELTIHAHKLNIAWEGKTRWSGGLPILENTNLKYHESLMRPETEGVDTSIIFEFVHNFKDHVEIKAQVSPKTNSVVLWLSPNNFHSMKASDFVGILFEQMPEMKVGNSFFKYGDVGAWTHPVVLYKPEQLEETDNQFFIAKYEDGVYTAILPLMGKGYASSIGKYQGMIGAKAHHSVDGHNENDIPILAIAFGHDPETVINNLYQSALGMSDELDSLKKQKNMPSLFKQLGWCSWNAFGHDVSHDKLIEVAHGFKQNNLPVKWMLIDDGWQDVTGRNGKLKSFGADPNKFPYGLAHTVKTLKQDYGIAYVGVWHTINGYWAGIEPSYGLGIKYREKLYPYLDKVTWTEDEPSVFFLPSPENGTSFYDDFYAYLSEQGIDFVKVDNQLIAGKVAKQQLSLPNVAEAMQANFQKAAQKYFGGAVLNCMCLTNDVLQSPSFSAVARSSEDYFPENHSFNIKAGNEAVHVYNNIMNNTWLHPIVKTDFDMFQSHRANAAYHALARVLNNGPVYITDYPNQHNKEVLSAMCLEDGTLLQAETPLLPLADCMFQPLGQGVFFGMSQYADFYLVGAWNTTDQLQASSFDTKKTVPFKTCLVYDWKAKRLQETDENGLLSLELDALSNKHFILFESQNFVTLGLRDKFICPAAIETEAVIDREIEIKLKEAGNFVAYCKQRVEKVTNQFGIEQNFQSNGYLLEVFTNEVKIKIQLA
jgi:raffinose synthase